MRYLLFPGIVRSTRDGGEHMITVQQLARLYQLNNSQWVAFDRLCMRLTDPEVKDRVWLTPRNQDDYMQHRQYAERAWQRMNNCNRLQTTETS